ncbi:IS110 family transposase, partial [Clostridium oryzae]|uniref:IS110 family transposase n=1 Tax=Clostridium oryzae TaxID=1450648 RepID=UPI001115D4EF
MEAIVERCAGLDVHEKTVVACILKGNVNEKPEKEIRTFNTTTTELLKLLEWLEESKCIQVAMESTGVYWKPIWNILETGSFEMILANARHIKNLPGRKTDVKDAEWIAQLLRSGLINKSFIPNETI